jgi:hypothetical protein
MRGKVSCLRICLGQVDKLSHYHGQLSGIHGVFGFMRTPEKSPRGQL